MSQNQVTEKIQQLVCDENKVVTYKLLSKELSVHVNKAKQLLNEYLTNCYEKGDNDLSAYYAVSGFQKHNGYQIHKLIVVSKDELDKIKATFSPLLSVHIYSIQKSPSLDECSLYVSDCILQNNSDNPNVCSAIRHPDIKIRENSVVTKIVSGVSKEKSKTVQPHTQQKSSGAVAKKPNALLASWQKKEENDQKSKAVKEQNGLPSPPKDEKANLNAKSKGSPKKTAKAADKGNKNNIMSLFSKQSAKSSKTNGEVSEKPITENSGLPAKAENWSSTKESKPVNVKTKEVKSAPKKKETSASKKKETSQKKRQLQRSRESSESDDERKKPQKKKHKRIVAALSDSESESEEEEIKDRAQRILMDSKSPIKESNNEISEDEEEPIPPTPPVQATNGKRKRLKTVSKTFEDEDGFLVTKTVKEYVTDSEDSEPEAPIPKKLLNKATPKPNIAQNFANKKQASLMSFFKQK